MTIRLLTAGDASVLERLAPGLFDDPLDPARTAEFLADPRHHLAVALDDGLVVGFASAVHYVHPDKPAPELWINEVAVAPGYRERGIGKTIVRLLVDTAREMGCTEAWVLTDRANPAGMRLYASVGGVESSPDQVLFSFDLRAVP